MLNHEFVWVFETPQELSEAAAEKFVKISQAAIVERGRFATALAGGNTPVKTYELIASAPFRNRIDWLKVHLFFGDERFVPLSHPESNYRMVVEALISRVGIPPENVHPVRTENDPATTARLYEDELRAFFPEISWPTFDLVFLGLGADGHTASLFPNTNALGERRQWVVANRVEGMTERITLTIPVINNGAHIIFLVTGRDKAEVVAQVINGQPNQENLPATLITPTYGSLSWFIDREAASNLS